MKALMHWVTENEAVLTMMTALLTFFLGRYTSYREDYREGRKEINDTFYNVGRRIEGDANNRLFF